MNSTTNKPPIANSPESINYVVSLLEQTLATHNEVRKPAEAQVTNLESTPGYCTILCDIIGARNNFSSNTRQTAILSFKNVTHQYWRSRSTNALQDEEKQHLRLKLLTLLDEPEDTIGIQVAILISKIARIDFPQFWPDLLDKLTAGIQDERDVVKQRSLLSLQHVVSVLCSRRLIGNRHQFQQFAPALFGFVSDLWNKLCEMLLGRIYQHAANGGVPAGEVSQLTSYAGMTSLCLKILRRTLEHGIPSFHQSKPVIAFLASCLERVKIFDEFRGKIQTGTLMTGIEQVITLHQKLMIHVQQAQPIPFSSFLLPSLQYFFAIFKTPFSHQPPPIPQAQINAMLFFKSVMTNSSYAPDTDSSTPRHADIPSSLSSLSPFGEANRIVTEFFTDPLIKDLIIVLISQYFLITSEELKDWEAEPEEFIREQEADAWRINRKPCAENLFLTILQQYEQCGSTLVVEYLQHVLKEPVTTDNAVLLREALYNAVGLGQYQLGLAINCSDLFANVFVGELQNPDPRWKILRRRIAWLLGNWVSNIKDDTRPQVYHALVTLMADPDLAVALTSAEAMRSLVDDVHFSVEQFKPYVDASITAIFRILSACEDSDTQLRVLSVAGVVIEQIGEHMKNHCTSIIGALGALWTTSCDQQLNLLKSSIVRALTKLVHAIGSDPMAQSMHSQIIPVVNYSSDFKSPDSVYLLEDGLLLWLAVLQYSNASSPTLLSLFPHLPEILDHTLEHLEVCMKVLETHLLLGMTDFMQQYAASVADTFSKVVGTVSDDGAMFVYKTLDTLLTLFPNEAPPLLENILTKILLLALDDNESDVAVTHHLSLFARVALQNLPFFLVFFDRVNNNPQNVEKKNYLVAFLIKWMDKIDNMGQPRMRKLSGLGFSSLLVSTGPRAQDILQGLAMIVSSMTGLIPDTDAPPEDFYELGYFDSSEASTSGSAAERQLHAMIKNDPVTTLTLKTFLLQKINEGIQVHGPPFQAIINSIDPVILKSLST